MVAARHLCRKSSSTILTAAILGASITTASAQALSCSGFLHGHDGTWRSLEDGAVFGPNGRVALSNGEILRPTDRGDKGDIARALNGLCESE